MLLKHVNCSLFNIATIIFRPDKYKILILFWDEWSRCIIRCSLPQPLKVGHHCSKIWLHFTSMCYKIIFRSLSVFLLLIPCKHVLRIPTSRSFFFFLFSSRCGSLPVSFLIFLVPVVNPHLFLVPVVNIFLLVHGVELQGRVFSSCKEESFKAAKRGVLSSCKEKKWNRDNIFVNL